MGGGDKPMRTIGGRTILDRVIARLAAAMRRAHSQRQWRSGAVRSVRPAGGRRHGGRIFRDRSPASSPRSTGRRQTGPNVTWVLSAAADCPFLPRDLVARLQQARIEQDAQLAVAASDGQIASGDRIVERRIARRTSPRAGRGGHPQDRPLDRALQARDGDVAGRRRSIRSSTPIRWMTSPKRSGWRSWMAGEGCAHVACDERSDIRDR